MPRNNRVSGRPQQPKTRDRIRRGRSSRRVSVRSELRVEPDVRRIARAVIELAMAQAEAEAVIQAQNSQQATGAQVSESGSDGSAS